MLSHALILDAAEAVIRRSRQPVGLSFIQRTVRVGFVTASQLLDALTAIGVLAATQPRRAVLVNDFDRAAVLDATHRAVTEGRREMTKVETWFDAARTPLPDRPDEQAVEEWLRAVRAAHYHQETPA